MQAIDLTQSSSIATSVQKQTASSLKKLLKTQLSIVFLMCADAVTFIPGFILFLILSLSMTFYLFILNK